MTRPHPIPFFLALAVLVSGCGGDSAGEPAKATPVAPRPALAVEAATPAVDDWPVALAANGDIAAWQEATISVDVGSYRITEVAVNVGDRVKKGQLLARIDSATVAAELAESRAEAAEAEAALAEAEANAERAKRLREEGFYSAQTGSQYLTGARTAGARLDAARARVEADVLRLARTRVLAPDDGVISARAASVGSLAQPGQELFRLIRQGRLEWRARVPEADLGRVRVGQAVVLTLPDGSSAEGRVRATAPHVDPATRDGLVYVDLASGGPARAGMFARGEFRLGHAPALSLPQSAVLVRDGFAYVYRLGQTGEDGLTQVALTKVETGRRLDSRIEIVAGLAADARVVASGGGFLADGDTVRRVEDKTAP